MIARYLAWTTCILLSWAVPVHAGDADDAQTAGLRSLSTRLRYHEGQIDIGNGLATLHLTNSFRFLDPAGTDTLLTGIWGNPAAVSKSLGAIVPASFDPFDPRAWAVVIDFSEDGYVDDSDADSINYDDLLLEMQRETELVSEQREKDGYPAIQLLGWAKQPRYDKESRKFYWAKELNFGSGETEHTLNYNFRILGRRGVLVLNAVSGISQLAEIEKSTPELLEMVEFNPGHRYADYTPGTDKVASYGLAALVAGGVAAKSGLFKALLVGLLGMKKFLVVGLLALVGALRSFLRSKAPNDTSSSGT